MSKPPTILEKIYAKRAHDVELAKQTPGTTPEDISRLLSMHLAPPLVPFVERLRRNPSNFLSESKDSPSVSLMAEIKRASPSKGAIALTTAVAEQALTYALGGASVISVLTEPHWFKGSLQDMLIVRQSISSIPDRPAVLRKEFILDEYQIAEARLYGADTVLLIVAMMNDELLTRLYKYSHSLGMEPLVEVNNADEMRRALNLGAKVIGVNNRNLHDFNVDMGTTSRLVDMVKDRDIILCALSGISNAQDVRTYKGEGVKAVLVGESLMRASDTAAFIRELLDWPDHHYSEPRRAPVVKASGVTSPEQAQRLVSTGASIIGLVFDPTLANSITLDQAKAIRTVFPRSVHNPPPNPTLHPNVPWFHSYLASIRTQCESQRPLLVGHFTTHSSHTLAFILEAIATVSLDLVQFDGGIPAEWARFIPIPVIRRFASPVSSSTRAQANEDGSLTNTAIIHGINDASQINRPGLHAFALVDLTVCNGSTTVYVPSKHEPNPITPTTEDTRFKSFAKGASGEPASSGTLQGIEGAKKITVVSGTGKWTMPVIITAGRQKVGLEVIKEIGAWCVDVEVGENEDSLEGYIKSIQG